jgi:prepilin-type N-terminal cleavage/methylation domain-containing protein
MTPTPSASPAATQGFTLIELAMVLLIVSLMLGGMLMPLSAQRDVKARGDTDRLLNDVRDAMIGYAAIHGYLPCPAPIPYAAPTPGREATRDATTGECPSRTGFVPWETLGVGYTDAWDHLLRYSVTPMFSDSTPITSLQSATGDITIQTRIPAGTLATIATAVPAVVFSAGASPGGAYQSTGAQIAASTSADEVTNTAGGTTFVTGTPVTTAAGGRFDDMVVWIPTPTLIYRLTAAGKL